MTTEPRTVEVALPGPDDEHPGIFARWFLPDDSTVGCDVPGSRRRNPQVWLTPFSRCTPTHARAVAAALLAAADRAERHRSDEGVRDGKSLRRGDRADGPRVGGVRRSDAGSRLRGRGRDE